MIFLYCYQRNEYDEYFFFPNYQMSFLARHHSRVQDVTPFTRFHVNKDEVLGTQRLTLLQKAICLRKKVAVEIDGLLGENVEESDEEYDERLAKERITEEHRNFALATMQKEAEYDGISIRQLFHGYNSAFTKCPIPHVVNSMKAGAGKSHLLVGVANYYPSKYVLKYNRFSDKALFHKSGEKVILKFDNESGQEITIPLQPVINRLLLEKEKLEVKDDPEDKAKIQMIKDKLKSLEERAEKLIDCNNTINIFLDTPQEELLNSLMTLVSQDTPDDQKYTFTDKSASGQIGSKSNRLRGTPCIAISKVIDDTKSKRFAEQNRRYVHVNRETTAKKIKTANRVIILKYGCIPEEYDKDVVSRADVAKAKHIVKGKVAKMS